MTIDLIYLAHGRPEFTEISLAALVNNTDWRLVNNFSIYTDGADWQWVQKRFASPQGTELLNTLAFGGPVAVLNHALQNSSADYLCKIDNDVMVPPSWLDKCLYAFERWEQIQLRPDLLGIEAWAPDPAFPAMPTSRPGTLGFRPTRNIGGIGFFSPAAFLRRPGEGATEFVPGWDLPTPNGRYGLTEWQWAHPHVVRGFVDPLLPVWLLDHHPAFRELNARYDAEGQQRRVWGEYPPEMSWLWEWWKPEGAQANGK